MRSTKSEAQQTRCYTPARSAAPLTPTLAALGSKFACASQLTRSVGRSKTQRGNSSTDFGSSSELSWPKTEIHFSRQGGWFFVFSHRLKALRLKSSAQVLLRFHTFARFVALQTWFTGQPRPFPNVPVRGICRAHCKHYISVLKVLCHPRYCGVTE